MGSVKITNPLKKDFVWSCNDLRGKKDKSARYVRSRTHHWGKMGLAKGSLEVSFVVAVSTSQDLIDRDLTLQAAGRLRECTEARHWLEQPHAHA